MTATCPLSYRCYAGVSRRHPLAHRVGTPRVATQPLGATWQLAPTTTLPLGLRIAGTLSQRVPLSLRLAGAPPVCHPLAVRWGTALLRSHPLGVRWRQGGRIPIIGLIVSPALLETMPAALEVSRGISVVLTGDDPVLLDPLPE